jgi:oligopeptidase B
MKTRMNQKLHAQAMILALFVCTCRTGDTPVEPPRAKKITRSDTTHGEVREDPYHWLRDRDNPDVKAYLDAENAYTAVRMGSTEGLQQTLYNEMVGRIKETDTTAPYRKGPYYYYTRTEQGKQYSIYCRKKGSLDGPEEILLDLNILAEGQAYLNMGIYEISPDQGLLAYSLDTVGSERYTVSFKNLETGRLMADELVGTYYDAAWADNRTFFYTTIDEAHRPFRLYRHKVGTPQADDVLVFEEKDERFFVKITKTRSERFLLMELSSQITSEVHVLPVSDPEGRFRLFTPRREGVEYSVDDWDDQWYVLTNDGAVNFKLMKTALDRTEPSDWQAVLQHREDTLIEGIDTFQDHLVVHERTNGLRQLRVRHRRSGEEHYVKFDEPVYTLYDGDNPEYETSLFRFVYVSLVTPKTVMDYDMDHRTRDLKKREEIGHYDPTAYRSERVCAGADGHRIPISLVFRNGTPRDGSAPLLLYGYGAYGITTEPSFKSPLVSLLDRGFIYAIAHVRGGKELGRLWYHNGKLLNKKNSFTDFIACAEFLINAGYTSRDKLAIIGGSAGGLLVGAVTNMRPDLFHAVVAKVPFVDVLNTMLDPTLPLTVIEYEEWGNPNDKVFYEYIKSYSPYDNVAAKAYPHMLVTAGLNDPRVSYWEPAKWVARLRATKTDRNLLLLKTNMSAGHSGASGRYDYLKDVAFEYAFLLDRMGLSS